MARSKFFIHCGLHKTGTTSLQKFLYENESFLRSSDFLYPASERPAWSPSGHHDYILKRTGDRRFVPHSSAHHDLESELSEFKGNAILSSEAFESLFFVEGSLQYLVDISLKTHRELVFIIYLRPQIDYALSLYRELVEGCGFGDLFTVFFDEICEQGRVRHWEEIYEFDYSGIVESLSNIENSRVVLRNYDSLVGGSIIPDFLQVVGLSYPPESLSTRIWENNKAVGGLYSILRCFYVNRVRRELTASEEEVIRSLCTENKKLRVSKEMSDRMSAAFFDSNRRLPWEWGISKVKDSSGSPTEHICAGKVFSAETQWLISEIAELLQCGSLTDYTQLITWAQKGWVKSPEMVPPDISSAKRLPVTEMVKRG